MSVNYQHPVRGKAVAPFAYSQPTAARVVGFFFGSWAATIGLETRIGPVDVNLMLFVAGAATAFCCFSINRLTHLRLGALDLAALALVTVRYAVEQISASALQHDANVQGLSISLYLLGAFFLVRLAVQDREELRAFLGGAAAPAAMVAVVAILQVLRVGPVTEFILQQTNSAGAAARLADGRLTRATSFIGHWSGLGGYLTVAAGSAGLAAYLDKSAGRKPSVWMVGVIGLTVVGAITTFTFAAIGMITAVVAAAALALGYRVRLLVAAGAIATVALALFGDSLDSRVEQQQTATNYLSSEFSWVPATLAVRIYYWLNEGLPAFADQPIWGWGHSVYSQGGTWPIQPSTINWPYPESEYIRVLVTGGFTEMIFFGLWVWAVLLLARRSGRILGAGAGRILLTLVVSLLIGSIINPYFSNPGVPALLWPLIGAVAWTRWSTPGEPAGVPDGGVR